MEEKNSISLLITTISMVIMTEVIQFHYTIGINYFPLVLAVFTMLIFNWKLKENNRANPLVTDIIVIAINAVATYFILGTCSYSSCLAVLIFAYFVEELDLNQIDFSYIKKMIIYYVLPLIGVLFVTKGFTYLVNQITKPETAFAIDYTAIAANVVFNTIMADICIMGIMLFIREPLNSNYMFEMGQIKMLIICCIILVFIAGTKITISCVLQSKSDDKIEKLNGLLQTNDLKEYGDLNFYPKINVNTENKNANSFNTVLAVYESNFMEIDYKKETQDLQQHAKEKGGKYSRNAKLKYYDEFQKYADRLEIHKENLSKQNISNCIIYGAIILGLALILWKNLH